MPSLAHYLPNLLPHYCGRWPCHSVLLKPTLWLYCCGNFQTEIVEPLREFSLEPLFCSSLLGSPGLHILLSGFVFRLTVLSLTCQWPVFLLPFPSLPFASCYCVPSGFVMYVYPLGVSGSSLAPIHLQYYPEMDHSILVLLASHPGATS